MTTQRIALVAVAGVAVVAGCSGQHHSNSLVEPNIAPPTAASHPPIVGEGGVMAGRFLAVGGPYGAPPSPQHGRLVLRRNGRVAMTIDVPRDGRFSFGVLAGRYSIVGHTPQFTIDGHQAPCRAPRDVTVRLAQTTHVNVYCQRN